MCALGDLKAAADEGAPARAYPACRHGIVWEERTSADRRKEALRYLWWLAYLHPLEGVAFELSCNLLVDSGIQGLAADMLCPDTHPAQSTD